MHNYLIVSAGPEDYLELITLWEASVRATHDFLTEDDIQHYKPLILKQYFDQLNLFCIKEQHHIAGFIGIDGSLIQMLFIHPNYRGSGFGKALLNYAIKNYSITSVDVNEQNEQAVGFYEHLNFNVTNRFEHDAAGKPYPILSMVLKPDPITGASH